ncbi:MAG: YopX family protein [Ruminococcus sp.]|nr:YopX family protein [Ruminococcus sp.]
MNFYEKTYIIHLDYMTKTMFEVYTETIGQYTGLNDWHGTKIFEGDIIEFADCWDEQHKGVVYWRSGSYNVDCSKSDSKDECFFRLFTAYACGAKVIGNIHDNPER